MFVILPFEKPFYAKHNFDVNYVGHPLLDVIETRAASSIRKDEGLSDLPIIAMLPGSRKHEISEMLPVMMKMKNHFPNYQYVIAGAPGQELAFYETFEGISDFKVIFNQTYNLLQESYCAVVTSGTASLETALFMVPEVVCYKGNKVSYHIVKLLIKVKYICLVNLILDKPVVTELIQNEFNETNLKESLGALLENEDGRSEMLLEYAKLNELLAGNGASKQTAKGINDFIKQN